MRHIHLRHITAGETFNLRLKVAECFDTPLRTIETPGESGRSIIIEHVISRRYKYTIKISTNETYRTDVADFLESFFFAQAKFLSLSNSFATPDDSTFMPVVSGDDEAAIEFIRRVKSLREWSFELTEKHGRSWDSGSKKWLPYTLP